MRRWRTYLVTAAVASGCIWVFGLAFLYAELHGDAEDALADYVRVDLPQARHAPGATHVALVGRVLPDKVVVKQTKSRNASLAGTDFYMVPIAPPDWRPGQRVRYVAKVVYDEELDALLGMGQGQEEVVLGRLAGDVPDRAVALLVAMSVPLDEQAQLVRWVPSRLGKPAVRDTWSLYWQRTWVACLGLSLVVAAFTMLRGFAVIHMKPGEGG